MGLRTMRELSGRLERRIADGLSLPGPLGGARPRSLAGRPPEPRPGSRSATGPVRCSASTTSRWCATDRQPRLVFVGPNLASAHAQLGEDPELFLRWIAIHETTHAIQFGSVPWLRPHLAGAS